MSKKPNETTDHTKAEKKTLSIPADAVQRKRLEPSRKVPASGESPILKIVDSRGERQKSLAAESNRFIPMAALAMSIFTVLTLALYLLDRSGWLKVSLQYGAGIEAYALRSILYLALIPLITTSIMILVFRPSSDYVLGIAPDRSSYFSAPLLGIIAGALVWCATQFISTFGTMTSHFLSTPLIWDNGLFHVGKTPLSTLITLFAAVLLPSTSLELLFRGVIQTSLIVRKRYVIAGIFSSLLMALAFFDTRGFVILFIMGVVSFWVRLMTDSLIASALTTATFSLALLFSRTIFFNISQWLFNMPLIEISKLRVYLLMCSLILIVLLLIPTALIKETSRRVLPEKKTRRQRKRDERHGVSNQQNQRFEQDGMTNQMTHFTLWGIACFCIVVLAALTFLV